MSLVVTMTPVITLTSDGIFACNSSDRMLRSVVDLITLIRYFALMIDK